MGQASQAAHVKGFHKPTQRLDLAVRSPHELLTAQLIDVRRGRDDIQAQLLAGRVDDPHDLQVERFYKSQTIAGQFIRPEGPIKTFSLRGIKDSPPYLHDGRLLTLEDVVEFFNLV